MSCGVAVGLAQIKPVSPDADLIAQCLRGHEGAWSALIAKYKNLIFSIPIRSGFTQEEAADIFQAVCLDLFCELSSLRDPQALAGWLIRVTRNKCFHKRRENDRYVPTEELEANLFGTDSDLPEMLVHEIEKEQHVRAALADLNPRCRALVEKLFFDLPVQPYQQVARDLGLAVGSIGIIRRRCLNCLRERLKGLEVG